MRQHLVGGRGARAKRVSLLLMLVAAIGALVMPSTSVAVGAHAKSHHHKKKRHKKHKAAHHRGSSPAPGTRARLKSHGQALKLAGLSANQQALKLGVANANQSGNWFGYNQGALESGKSLFTSIAGNWTVPTATQHTTGQAESSSDWIGIGGGCMDTSCTSTDSTLIQTGTEQDVGSNGAASYSAWYELIPAPSIGINVTVSPGDQMHASIAQSVPGLWTVTLQDVTRGENFTTTVPYSSSEGSAEWIEETPLVIGTNAGFAALPNLATVPFSSATANGTAANFQPAEEMDLTANGTVIGAPSTPKSTQSFDACAWASSCS